MTPDELKALQEQAEVAKDLASTYEKMKKSLNGITAEEKEILNIAKQLSKTASDIEKSTDVRLDSTKSLKDLIKSTTTLLKDQKALEDAGIKLAAEQLKATQKKSILDSDSAKLKRELISLEFRHNQIIDIYNNKSLELAGIANSRLRVDKDRAKILRQELSDGNKILKSFEREVGIKEKLIAKADDLVEKQEDHVKGLNEGIKAHDEIKTALDEEIKKAKSLGTVLTKAFNDATKSFSLGALMKQVWNFVLAADVQVTELAKSLGLSKNQARGIRDNFAQYAKSTGDNFVTTKKLMEAQSELTSELGVAGTYTGKQTEDFSRLTKLMGLSANEAGKIARLSVINGKSIEDTTKSIIKGSFAAQVANKISIDQRTILKEVANLSEGILIKFQGNPEALGAAVVQAKKLGLNLNEVDKIGESLLNWESSIENELKAELITGKQINLEKARYAALTGDQATLMAEVANQVGDLNEYSNMNIIAQKSLAEAFGMSRDEMSKMLLDQEKFNKLGDVSDMTLKQQLENLKAQGEPIDSVLYKQIQQQSIQEKFNNAIEKMQEIVGNLVAGPLGSMLDTFAAIADHATVLYGMIGLIAGISLVKTIGGLITMGIQMGVISAEAIATSSALTLGLGTIGILTGIGILMGALSSAKSEASTPKYATGGIVGGNSYIGDNVNARVNSGEMVLTKPQQKALYDTANGGGGGNSNSTEIKDMHATLKEYLSRPSIARIDGERPFVQTISRTQMNGSYGLA
jgi:hypothetical protein